MHHPFFSIIVPVYKVEKYHSKYQANSEEYITTANGRHMRHSLAIKHSLSRASSMSKRPKVERHKNIARIECLSRFSFAFHLLNNHP